MTSHHISRGRALKYQAARAPGLAERARLFGEAADAYAHAGEGTRSTYALINAATLFRMADRTAAARGHARTVLDMLDTGDHDPDTPYWLAATRAEALLVLGDEEGAETALAAAVALAPRAWEEHAITLRQFRLLLQETGRPTGWLDRFRVPPVMAFGGTMGIAPDDDAARSEIARAVNAIGPCEAYGALAAGADILAAEAVLAREAELHAVLPLPPEAFRAESVEVIDRAWGARFDACHEWATSVDVVAGAGDAPAGPVAFATELALGQAIARAQALETDVVGLLVTAGEGGNRAVAALWRHWAAEGLALRRIELARSAGAPRPDSDQGRPVALLASAGDAQVREFASLADALACVAMEPGGRFGLDYGVVGAGLVRPHALATALRDTAASEGVRASDPAAYAARLADPRITGELAGAVHYASGMADFHRLYLPSR